MLNLAATFLIALARRIKRTGVIINEHTLTRAQTSFHVRVLSRWFEFIRLDELPRRLARRGKRPFCLLTFDDGKRSNFTETAPELERLGVPAVFYLTTGPVTSGAHFWFDLRTQFVKAVGHCPPALELDALKQLPFAQLTERLEKAFAEYQFEPADDSDDLRPMTWEHARSLHRCGFAIGAHGSTHAILTHESRQRAFVEIEESLAKVSQELGAPCNTFAFPNGNYTTELAQHALRCGASTVMTTEPMWVDDGAFLWRLPRVQLFGELSRARIEAKLALAAFKGILPNPNGTGRSYSAARREGGTHLSEVPVPILSRRRALRLRPALEND